MTSIPVDDRTLLRRMEREDIPRLKEILAGAFESERLGEKVAADLNAHCDRGQHLQPLQAQRQPVPAEYWVAEDQDGTVICISGLYRFEWAWEKCLWLGWFAVAPDRQGQGLGSAVVETLFRVARAKGCEVLKVETGKGSRAVEFYRRLGFVEEAVLSRHYSAALDAQVLARDMADIDPAEGIA